MKRNLDPLALLTAGLMLLTSVPAFAQEQTASAFRKSDVPGVAAKPAAALSPEAYRAQLANLGKRKAALQMYLGTVAPASADYQATQSALAEIENKLEEMTKALASAESQAANTAVPALAVPTSHQQPPIVFVNPDRSETVNVKEYLIKVDVPDPKIKSLYISIYKEGAKKPYIARRVQLERGDTGASEVVALIEGANRIVVEDAATMAETDATKKKLAEVVLTYEPPQREALGASAGPPEFNAGQSEPRPEDTVICGQLQLASLNQTLTLIKATPELSDLAVRFRPPANPTTKLDTTANGGPLRPETSEIDDLVYSRLDDGCRLTAQAQGAQKIAVADVLRAALVRLESNLRPNEDLQLNREARTQSLEDLLYRTSAPVRTTAAEDPERGFTAAERAAERAKLRATATEDVKTLSADAADELNMIRGSEFESLSAATIRKQILLLEEYLGNVSVQLKDRDGNVVDRVRSDRDGNFRFVIKNPQARQAGGGEGAGATTATTTTATPTATPATTLAPTSTPPPLPEYTVSTEGDMYFTTATVVARPGVPMRVNILIQDKPVSLLARALVGYDQAGAAASKAEQTFFFNVYLNNSFPFRQKIDPDFGERIRLWGDFRINSVPQSGDSTVRAFATGGFATQVGDLRLREVARVFEFLGGFEFRLKGNNALLPSFDRKTRQKFALSLIGGVGSVTPLDSQEGIAIFKVFDDAPGLPPEAKGKEFVAFTRTDRDRFFRQYYVGFRVNTFFFNNYNVPIQRFPAQLDVLVGQNEFVTGGKLAGPVLRFDGFFPLPYEDYKWINLYASAMMRPGGARTDTPLILQPAPTDTTLPAANVALFALPQPNRDYYRIGFGVDFLSLANKILNSTNTSK